MTLEWGSSAHISQFTGGGAALDDSGRKVPSMLLLMSRPCYKVLRSSDTVKGIADVTLGTLKAQKMST